MALAAGKSAAQKANLASASALAHASHILLTNVPRTATPKDVRRAILLADVAGVKAIRKVYERYRPTNQAVLQMTLPDYTRDALHKLTGLTLGTLPISSQPTVDPRHMEPKRTRGVIGRRDLLERGSMTGDGVQAGGWPPRSTVTLSGVPTRTQFEHMAKLADGFEMASKDVKETILKCPPANIPGKHRGTALQGFSIYSRWIFSFKDAAEAERFVRKYNQTQYKSSTLVVDIIY